MFFKYTKLSIHNMKEISASIFKEFPDLYKLTSKTADNHIAFYKNKDKVPTEELFNLWKNLTMQADEFDNVDWTENWYNWDKNFQAFEKHKLEAKYLIQSFLTHVLEELLERIIKKIEVVKLTPKKEESEEQISENMSNLIK